MAFSLFFGAFGFSAILVKVEYILENGTAQMDTFKIALGKTKYYRFGRAPSGPGILEKSRNLKICFPGPGKVQEFENKFSMPWKILELDFTAKDPGKVQEFVLT